MAQQQQLLLVLGLLIIGVAVSTGIKLYQENGDSIYLSQIEQDLQYLATKAQEYYHKPTSLEGGKKSFSKIKKGTAGLQKYLEVGAVYGNKKSFATYQVTNASTNSLIIQADGIAPVRTKIIPRYTVTITGKDYKIKRTR
ncbi:MAG: hypothetical protein WDA22_02495 [Bacteroidota bacterium]